MGKLLSPLNPGNDRRDFLEKNKSLNSLEMLKWLQKRKQKGTDGSRNQTQGKTVGNTGAKLEF